MELNITSFFLQCAPMDYSASVAELGPDAGQITWAHAIEDSPENMLLDSDEKREAFRDFVRSFGAWSDDEIRAWSDVELNALCIQWVAGDLREMGVEDPSGPIDWAQIEREANEGNGPGRIWPGTDGEIYFDIGN